MAEKLASGLSPFPQDSFPAPVSGSEGRIRYPTRHKQHQHSPLPNLPRLELRSKQRTNLQPAHLQHAASSPIRNLLCGSPGGIRRQTRTEDLIHTLICRGEQQRGRSKTSLPRLQATSIPLVHFLGVRSVLSGGWGTRTQNTVLGVSD